METSKGSAGCGCTTNSIMKKAINYTGICIVYFCHDGKGNILMNQRSEKTRDEHGVWDIGGGSIHHGEYLEDAVKRELLEEYMTEPLEMEQLGYREVHRSLDSGEKTHWIAFDYKVLVDPDKVENGEPDKHIEVKWFKMGELPKPLHSQLPFFLDKYKSSLFEPGK